MFSSDSGDWGWRLVSLLRFTPGRVGVIANVDVAAGDRASQQNSIAARLCTPSPRPFTTRKLEMQSGGSVLLVSLSNFGMQDPSKEVVAAEWIGPRVLADRPPLRYPIRTGNPNARPVPVRIGPDLWHPIG